MTGAVGRVGQWLSRPLPVFVLLVLARPWLGSPSGEALLLLAFPLAFFVDGARAHGVLGQAALAHAGRRLLCLAPLWQFVLLAVFLDRVVGLRSSGTVGLVALLALRAVRRPLLAIDAAGPSVLPREPGSPAAALAARAAGEVLWRVTANMPLLLLVLYLLLDRLLHEPWTVCGLVALALVLRRNRRYLIERGWSGEQALKDVLELEEPYRWLVRLALPYAVLGAAASVALGAALAAGAPPSGQPWAGQALAALVVSVPAAVAIHRRPRLAGVFLVGWCCCTMAVAAYRANREPAQLLSLGFWASELLLPVAMIWNLRDTVSPAPPAAAQPL